MSQSADQARLRTRLQNMCTYQYTKKNDHETRQALDIANAKGLRRVLTTSLPAHLYTDWESRVAALKPKKRKAWKGHVLDTFGQKTVAVYCEEGIPVPGRGFVSHFKHRLCGQKQGQYRTEDEWRVVIPTGLPYLDIGPDGKPALHTRCASAVTAADLAELSPIEQINALRVEMEGNLTYAHRPKNHHISVPTVAGQPTRG